MNRTIKFRVWTGSQMEYNIVAGQLGAFYAKIDPSDSACLNPTSKYYPETPVMQFTGLTDKNGKEIYEGDILSSEVNEKPCNYIVKWSDNRSAYCGFALNPIMKNPPKITFHIHDFRLWMAEGFNIIGNIYENPELLN